MTAVLLASLTATPSFAAQSKAVEVPLAPYFEDLRTATVEIGGEKVPFLIDTGGGITVLTPATAAKTGLKPFGQVTGFRFNGEKLVGQRCGPVTLRLGGRDLRCEAAVMDLESLGVKGVGGILALQTFEGQAITLDVGGNRLILESAKSMKQRVSHMHELTVRAERQCSGAALDLYARALASDGDLWLELDCGSTQPVLLAPHSYQQLGMQVAGTDAAAVRLELAGLEPMTVDARPADAICDGLLNSAFFRQRLVTFDLKAIRVWVEPRTGS
jgi:hypothetical protein